MPYDDWLTPPNLLGGVREFFQRSTNNGIDLDPASNDVAQEFVRAKRYCKLGGVNGLEIPWEGNIWLNPPYSAGNVDKFVDKAIETVQEPFTLRKCDMLVLVNSSTDTGWYHKLLLNSRLFLLFRGRLKFWKIENGVAYEKWEGQKSKERGLNKVGNSPRYLNTLFYLANRPYDNAQPHSVFRSVFSKWGTVCTVSDIRRRDF